VRRDVPVREGGPATLPTRLPVERIVEALAAEGYEVRTSDDAGGYLCNHLFYEMLTRLPDGAVAGFVHVPPLEPPWDLPRLRSAVRTLLERL
jgi:pyroglutamyl-peptidase